MFDKALRIPGELGPNSGHIDVSHIQRYQLKNEATLAALTEETVKSSAIEGEELNAESVRSSLARRMGLEAEGTRAVDRNVEGVVEMMLDATHNYAAPLTEERIFGWHAALFPTGRSEMRKITTAAWRTGPIEVDSGPEGKTLRSSLKKIGSKSQDIHKILREIVSFVDKEAFQALHPQYAQGDYFSSTMAQLVSYLNEFRKSMGWNEALDELEGTNAVPIMTIHKSKGLEYHTIVFVGFEDSAFWNFHKKPTEETCTFFVAFSRAKNRVVFTFCEHRAKPADAPFEPQHRATVGPLYAILEQAGVHIEHIAE